MKSKSIIGILLIILCVILFCSLASAESGTWGNLTWNLDTNGVLNISGIGEMDDFPENSSSAWLSRRNAIKEVYLGSEITSIGNHAFYSCNNLVSILFPNNLNKIGYGSFYKCSSLSSISLPDSITEIENTTFAYCSHLSSINIPVGGKVILPSLGKDFFTSVGRQLFT